MEDLGQPQRAGMKPDLDDVSPAEATAPGGRQPPPKHIGVIIKLFFGQHGISLQSR
jgi:hypothetical protein